MLNFICGALVPLACDLRTKLLELPNKVVVVLPLSDPCIISPAKVAFWSWSNLKASVGELADPESV